MVWTIHLFQSIFMHLKRLWLPKVMSLMNRSRLCTGAGDSSNPTTTPAPLLTFKLRTRKDGLEICASALRGKLCQAVITLARAARRENAAL